MKYYKCDKHKIEFAFLDNSSLSFERHNHISIYAVGLLLKGSVVLNKENIAYQFTDDDLFIIPPYMVHSLVPTSEHYSIVTLCIGTEFLDTYDFKDGKALLSDLAGRLVCDGVLTHLQVEAFSDALELVYDMYSKPDYDYAEIISETKNFIEARPEDDITLDALSQKIFVSKYYLIREFKKTIGLSPHRFQIQNRIRKAQHLLQNGSAVTETALAMGFYDQSHFIKYFKKIVGITPTEYIDSLETLD
ncbi:helix-turn-helix domain-containing protein [Acetobacterium bakii]|uniref:helix-turn-helix domain-containing protein n=1 Tax=Acetobacterium bakii TaxID=52689 RepID=UPI0006819F9C|nr:AraC family transcriptional regulator [Acetobacterium bakii]